MNILQLFFLSITGVLLHSTTYAQEVIAPLQSNPRKSAESAREHLAGTKSTGQSLTLPFWDDFTYPGPYPDAALWADNYVFINSGFGVHPKTYGIATFDILDDTGQIYGHANVNNVPFVADHLTSHNIRLDSIFNPGPAALSPADSIMLSFYYQPQGRGGDPSSQDSLVLQFYLPGGANGGTTNANDGKDGSEDALWQTVWYSKGESLKNFAQDTFPYFHRVRVPITDEKWFRNDFRFRFRNYASFAPGQTIPNNSASGNIWNIDYVYLDRGRSIHDTTYYDVAFAAPAQSLLRDYTAIPWSHYIADPPSVLRNNFSVRITNLDNTSYNYTYRYVIRDEAENTIRTYSGGSWVIAPFSEEGYQDYQPHTRPIVLANPLPTAPAPKRHFQIIHSLREGATGDDFTRNDSIVFDQNFSNYFSYDDGAPEMISLARGYDPRRAVQFVARHPDTIEAVQLFLMETISNQDQQQGFEIMVWSSLDPEEELYRSPERLFVPDEWKGGFATFPLTDHVQVEDTFYVGIRQPGNINLGNSIVIGFDLSNDVSHRRFENTGEGYGWLRSVRPGTLMVRPVMLRDDIMTVHPPKQEDLRFTAYPNPASGNTVHIRFDEPEFTEKDHAIMRVYDTRGRLLHNGPFEPLLSISGWPNGIYLLHISNTANGNNHTTRFIISR